MPANIFTEHGRAQSITSGLMFRGFRSDHLPVYHFDTFNGEEVHDLKGVELNSLREAKAMAIRYLGELMNEKAEELEDDSVWRVEVKNHQGLILFCLNLSMIIAPNFGPKSCR